jgi:hypothetical protein
VVGVEPVARVEELPIQEKCQMVAPRVAQSSCPARTKSGRRPPGGLHCALQFGLSDFPGHLGAPGLSGAALP